MDDELTLKQQLSQLVISEEQQREIDGHLEQLRVSTQATSILLIERSGLLLASYGDEIINDLSISSLVAGIFKSISALTALLGERSVKTLAHRGNRSTLLLLLLDSQDMLAVMVPADAEPADFEGPLASAASIITPVLLSARESTRNKPFSFSKDSISVFLGRL